MISSYFHISLYFGALGTCSPKKSVPSAQCCIFKVRLIFSKFKSWNVCRKNVLEKGSLLSMPHNEVSKVFTEIKRSVIELKPTKGEMYERVLPTQSHSIPGSGSAPWPVHQSFDKPHTWDPGLLTPCEFFNIDFDKHFFLGSGCLLLSNPYLTFVIVIAFFFLNLAASLGNAFGVIRSPIFLKKWNTVHIK